MTMAAAACSRHRNRVVSIILLSCVCVYPFALFVGAFPLSRATGTNLRVTRYIVRYITYVYEYTCIHTAVHRMHVCIGAHEYKEQMEEGQNLKFFDKRTQNS